MAARLRQKGEPTAEYGELKKPYELKPYLHLDPLLSVCYGFVDITVDLGHFHLKVVDL